MIFVEQHANRTSISFIYFFFTSSLTVRSEKLENVFGKYRVAPSSLSSAYSRHEQPHITNDVFFLNCFEDHYIWRRRVVETVLVHPFFLVVIVIINY